MSVQRKITPSANTTECSWTVMNYREWDVGLYHPKEYGKRGDTICLGSALNGRTTYWCDHEWLNKLNVYPFELSDHYGQG